MNFSSYTTKSTEEILDELQTATRGLDEEEAAGRRAKAGFNEIKAREIKWWQIFFRQFKSPFIYILFFAAAIGFSLNEIIEASMILTFVLVNAALSFFQEYHSEKNLKILKQYIVPRAKVRRGGEEMNIPSRDLVPGDIVVVEAGDMIPADIRFFEENNLVVDEEILTGESVSVNKVAAELPEQASEIYKAKNIGFSGTTLTGGRGVGVVFATGRNTAIGGIAKMTIETERISGFEKGILGFSKFILRLILITIVLVFMANVFIRGAEANIGELVIFSIALAISVIPEPLPVVTTVSLSRGALQLAKNKVIVKRLSSIDDLGSIEVLCTDKTGTLTENKLTVSKVLAKKEKDCVFNAALAASFWGKKKGEPTDAFDAALWSRLSDGEKEEIGKYVRVAEAPFDPVRRRNSLLVEKGGQCKMIVRGAPEVIFDLCRNIDETKKQTFREWMSGEGELGHRVIAVAEKDSPSLKCYGHSEENNLNFLGVISFVDPIKKSAPNAITRARKLGVQIKILTGDSMEVAGAVAYKIGLTDSPKKVMLGDDFDKLDEYGQHEAVEKFSAFARVSPEQKYRIIKILEEKYEVGFLGEGINDAPALKIANVALVVQSASDISREAADVVLLKKSLEVIVDGIQEGRKIFANITKYIKVTLASNFGNFFAVATASLLLDFLPMLPAQILLLNLLSDFPMIAIATDNVDADELKRPKSYNVRSVVLLATVLGIVSTIFDFIFFGIFARISPAVLQTNWLIGSILTELILIFSVRTKFFFVKGSRVSRTLGSLALAAAAIAIALPFTKFGQVVFNFARPRPAYIITILAVTACYFIITESVKLIYYRFLNHDRKSEA